MMPPGLASWFDQTVKVAPYSGSGRDGSPTYGADADRKARIASRDGHAITEQGRVAAVSATIMILGPDAVGVKDRLTMPDGSAHEILGVGEHRGPDGTVWWYEVTI